METVGAICQQQKRQRDILRGRVGRTWCYFRKVILPPSFRYSLSSRSSRPIPGLCAINSHWETIKFVDLLWNIKGWHCVKTIVVRYFSRWIIIGLKKKNLYNTWFLLANMPTSVIEIECFRNFSKQHTHFFITTQKVTYRTRVILSKQPNNP